MAQMALYQHGVCLASDRNMSPFPPLVSGHKDTLPNDPYIQYMEMQSRRAGPGTGATLFGADSFAPELRQIMEVTRNLYKRKRASEEPSQAPSFCPSSGAMETRPTLPPASTSLGSPDGHTYRVTSIVGSSDTMVMRPVQVVSDARKRVLDNPGQPSSETIFTRPVPRVVLDKGKQVVETPRQPSSETMFVRPVPRVVLDKGKQIVESPGQHPCETMFTRHVPFVGLDKGEQVVENPSSRLLFRSSKSVSTTKPANLCRHVVAPAPALTLAAVPTPTPPAPDVLDKGKRALEEPILATPLAPRQAQPISKGRLPPCLLNQISHSRGL